MAAMTVFCSISAFGVLIRSVVGWLVKFKAIVPTASFAA
jgi:hypothetical protein